jgi:type II secretory pathway component PulC
MTRSALFLTGEMTTKLLVLAVSAVFASLIIMQAYQLWQTTQSAPVSIAAAPVRSTLPVKSRADVRQLAASHLFGDTRAVAPEYTEIKEDKSLNLTLRGIVANRGGNTSLAIIGSSPSNEETFAIGDSIFNKGTLNHVADDHVILKRSNGQLARLQLPDQNVDETISEEFLPLAQPDYHEDTPVEPPAVVEQLTEPEQTAEPEMTIEQPEATMLDNSENADSQLEEFQDPQQDIEPQP